MSARLEFWNWGRGQTSISNTSNGSRTDMATASGQVTNAVYGFSSTGLLAG
mgnify:CR=1 FL=1